MSRPLGHWLLLLALVAMWGSAFALTGIAVRGIDPVPLVAIRLVVAAALLTGLVLIRRQRFPGTGRFWWFALLIALAGNCVPFTLISFGQIRVPSGLTGILMGIMPLAVMVMAHFLVAGERLNAVKAMGFGLGFVGLVILIGPEALLQARGLGSDLLYLLAILGGALCYATNTIIARRRPPADPVVAAAAVMLTGSLVMAPFGLPEARAAVQAAPMASIAAMIALAVVATAIATVVFLKLIALAGPSFTSFINYLIPLWALGVGVLFLGEEPEPRALVALVLILGGIGLGEIGARRALAPDARQAA
ncbi:MAG TPA: DMT family transporter [Geminicoccaceae bacterium]